ncbi:MAG: 6-phosphogluconolactonase [Oligoflexus sp.]
MLVQDTMPYGSDKALSIHAFTERKSWSQSIAEMLVEHLEDCQQKGRRPKLALPGGSTPKQFLAELGKHSLPKLDIEILPTDERAVALNDPRRNDAMLGQALQAHMQVRLTSFVERPTSPQKMLRSLQKKLSQSPDPLSLAILGMGTDGHIASIFPLRETAARSGDLAGDCLWVQRRGEDFFRLSLGWQPLLCAENLWLILLGQEKMDRLQLWLDQDDQSRPVIKLLQSRPVTLIWSP